jgi:hypothetical protein
MVIILRQRYKLILNLVIIFHNYFVILEEKAIFLYLKAVPRIEKKLGYE